MRDPKTQNEWQEAADGALFLLLVDSARQYGLIETDIRPNVERCQEILQRAKQRGITPKEPAK